jgi:PEP-CTERM motif
MRMPSLVSAALVLVASTAGAHAAPVTIDFNTIGGANNSTFSTYSESGFTVISEAGTWFVSSGNGSFANPEPDIFTQPSGTIAVTDGGGLFNFDTLDLGIFNVAAGGAADYTITGLLNGVAVYTQSGSSSSQGFVTLNGTHQSTAITSFTIALSGNPDGVDVDNIGLNTVAAAATPEPSTLALFGTGILGLAGMARRKFLA